MKLPIRCRTCKNQKWTCSIEVNMYGHIQIAVLKCDSCGVEWAIYALSEPILRVKELKKDDKK